MVIEEGLSETQDIEDGSQFSVVLFVSGVGSSGWRKNTYWRTLCFSHNHPLTVLGGHTLCDAARVPCSCSHCFLTSVLPTTSYHNFSYSSRSISSTWLPSNLPCGLFHVPTPVRFRHQQTVFTFAPHLRCAPFPQERHTACPSLHSQVLLPN